MNKNFQAMQEIDLEAVPFLDSHVSLEFPLRFRYIVEAYEIQQKMNCELLTMAIGYIFKFHALLRLRVLQKKPTMKFFISKHLPADPVLWIDIAHVSAEQQQNAISTTMREVYASLNDYDSFLCRFIYFNLGEQSNDLFFMMVHHVLADGYSIHILSEDIQKVYLQILRNKSPHLTVKTASYNEFAERIRKYLYLEFPNELGYWRSLKLKTKPFPVDYPANRLTDPATGETNVQVSMPCNITLSLNEEETELLLNRVPAARSRVEDVLLAGLVQSVTRWLAEPGVHVYTINNGRMVFKEIDVSRTLGCIALGSWQYFQIDPTLSPEELLQSITQQRNYIPHKGIGLSLAINYAEHKEPAWSQFCGNEDREALKEVYFSDNIMFNYLGKGVSSLAKKGLFCQAGQEYRGLITSPDSTDALQKPQKPCKLNAIITVQSNKLILTWEYDKALYRATTIESLAKDHLNGIRAIINAISKAV